MTRRLGLWLCLVALASVLGCNNPTVQLGSVYVKSAQITAAGGSIEVSKQDSADLAGTKLTIPPGALSENTKITVGLDHQSVVDLSQKAGEVAVFGPPGTKFSTPATLTLPFKLTATQKIENLYVMVLEDNKSTKRISGSALTVDAANSLVSFQVNGFTRFQPGSGAAAPCTANSDCAAGQTCVSGVCQVSDPCAGVSCPTGQICQAGTCVCDPATNQNCNPVCTKDSECGSGKICTKGACVAVRACAADTDCAQFEQCYGGICRSACSGLPGYMCSTGCVDLNTDVQNCGGCGVACAAGEVCQGGVCKAPGVCTFGQDQTCNIDPVVSALWGHCNANGTCTCNTGFKVDPVTGKCQVDVTVCATDRDCPAGEYCISAICSPMPCAAGLTMCSGACVDLTADSYSCGACGTACGGGEICSGSVCIAACMCVMDAECMAGAVCRSCVCVGGCATDADCVAGEVCMAGACQAIPRTCVQAGGVCGALTSGGVTCPANYAPNGSAGTCAPGGGCCLPAPACTTDADCAAGTSCVNGVCQAIALTCAQVGGKCGALTGGGIICDTGYASDPGAGTCPVGGSCCMPATVTCRTDSECIAGQVCVAGACAAMPSCQQVGGVCGALTSGGVLCPVGYVASGAGLCAPGGGCCMPAGNACATDTDCIAGETCVGGLCQGICAAGETKCAGACVDLQTDVGNCGACGTSCTTGQVCSSGTCTLTGCTADTDCAAGEVCMGGVCQGGTTCEIYGGVCGALTRSGIVCPAGYVADGSFGTCAVGGGCCAPKVGCTTNADCPNHETCQSGACAYVGCAVDTDCTAGLVCVAGQCHSQGACAGGQSMCTGACVDLQSDVANCGACGAACPAGMGCTAGVCTGSARCTSDTDCAPLGKHCIASVCQ